MTKHKQRVCQIGRVKCKQTKKMTEAAPQKHDYPVIRSFARQSLTLNYRVYADLFSLRVFTCNFLSPAKCVGLKPDCSLTEIRLN